MLMTVAFDLIAQEHTADARNCVTNIKQVCVSAGGKELACIGFKYQVCTDAATGTTPTSLGMANTHLSKAINDLNSNNTQAALSELHLVNSSLAAHIKELQNVTVTVNSSNSSNMTNSAG
jgi:hypothetical protein